MSKAHELARKIAADFCTIGDHNPRLERAVLEAIFKVAHDAIEEYIKTDHIRREIPGRILSENKLSEVRTLYSDLSRRFQIVQVQREGFSTIGRCWLVWTNGDDEKFQESYRKAIEVSVDRVRQLLACNEFLERLVGELQQEYPDRAATFQAGVNAGIEAVAIKLETEGIRTDRGSVLPARKCAERIRALKHSADNPRTDSGSPPNVPTAPEEPSTPNYVNCEFGDGANYAAGQYPQVDLIPSDIDYTYD
jgi:hypothetical protein